ncbi:MAG: hypothetical protein M3377_04165, partial [Actinomycetota bacterium]|nr:hypothetical protein [Actinomycetota bacterium]
MPQRPSASFGRAAYIRTTALAIVALVAATFVVADPVGGAGESAFRAAAVAWDGVFGDRPRP